MPKTTTPTKAPAKNGAKSSKTETRIIINQQELGSSGLPAAGGFISAAYNTALQWPSAYPIYNKMRRSTPEIVMIRNAFTAWARNISITVTLPEEPTDDDKKYQDFVESVFEDMEGGTDRFIDTLVNHVPFMGWGWWEIVAGRRNPTWKPPTVKTGDNNGEKPAPDEWRSEHEDDLIGIRRLAWRDAGTFYKWDLDNNTKRLKGMYQRDYPNPIILLPLKDSLHMTYGDPNNPEGLSPLEAVWRLERIHYGLSVIMGIGFEHSAGHLSVKKVEQGSLSSDDKSLVKNAAMAILSAQEGNYALWPYGLDGQVMDIGFASAGSLLSSMQHYSTLMLSVYTMQWMALNTMTGTGSYAAADDSSTMGVYTYNSMLEGFAEQLDQQVGKKLWEWNKDKFPNATKRPRITFTKIEKNVALSEMSSFVSQMKDILPLSNDDLLAIRKRSGFLLEVLPDKKDLMKQAKEKMEIGQAAQPPQITDPNADPNADPYAQDNAQDPSATDNWDTTWNGQLQMDDTGQYSFLSSDGEPLSTETSLNFLAKKYYEMHYGGASGNEPHKNGTPQSIHDKPHDGKGVNKATPKGKAVKPVTTKKAGEEILSPTEDGVKILANMLDDIGNSGDELANSKAIMEHKSIAGGKAWRYEELRAEFANKGLYMDRDEFATALSQLQKNGDIYVTHYIGNNSYFMFKKDEGEKGAGYIDGLKTPAETVFASAMSAQNVWTEEYQKQISYNIFSQGYEGDKAIVPILDKFVADGLMSKNDVGTYIVNKDALSKVYGKGYTETAGDGSDYFLDPDTTALSQYESKKKEISDAITKKQYAEAKKSSDAQKAKSAKSIKSVKPPKPVKIGKGREEKKIEGVTYVAAKGYAPEYSDDIEMQTSTWANWGDRFKDTVTDGDTERMFQKYQDGEYANINKSLRGPTPAYIKSFDSEEEAFEAFDNDYGSYASDEGVLGMQEAIKNNIQVLEQDTVVYRTARIRNFDEIFAGFKAGKEDTFSDAGFMSTSIRASMADSWGGSSKNVFMEIRLPKGYKEAVPIKFGKNDNEEEVLLNAGSTFKIKAIHFDDEHGNDGMSADYRVILEPVNVGKLAKIIKGEAPSAQVSEAK